MVQSTVTEFAESALGKPSQTAVKTAVLWADVGNRYIRRVNESANHCTWTFVVATGPWRRCAVGL
jgi:hypothetical protein